MVGIDFVHHLSHAGGQQASEDKTIDEKAPETGFDPMRQAAPGAFSPKRFDGRWFCLVK